MGTQEKQSDKGWIRYAILVLLAEKVVQHVLVTGAFLVDWHNIRSTVAVAPTVLTILGAGAAVLFGVALWATLTGRSWAALLVIAMGLFDMVGEPVAQGRVGITLNVSFIVAAALIVLVLIRGGQARRDTRGF